MEAERYNTGKWASCDAERANVFAAHKRCFSRTHPLPHVSGGQLTDPLNFSPNEIENVIKEQLNPKKQRVSQRPLARVSSQFRW